MTDFADLARLHAEATPGPWEATFALVSVVGGEYPNDEVATTRPLGRRTNPDAAFIAAARNAVPDILRICEETLALHRCVSPIHNMRSQKCKFRSEVSLAWQEPCRVCEGEDWDKCAECRAPYPCPTVRIWNGESE